MIKCKNRKNGNVVKVKFDHALWVLLKQGWDLEEKAGFVNEAKVVALEDFKLPDYAESMIPKREIYDIAKRLDLNPTGAENYSQLLFMVMNKMNFPINTVKIEEEKTSGDNVRKSSKRSSKKAT